MTRSGSRGLLWGRLLTAPLWRRRARLRLSLGALALAAGLATALFTLAAGAGGSLSRQFRRYGANLVGTPAGGGRLPLRAEAAARSVENAGVGVQYVVAAVAGHGIVVAGGDPDRLWQLNRSWRVRGATPGGGECWLGVNAARQLGLRVGDELVLTLNGRQARWRVAGTVSSGGSEDDQALAPYAAVAALSGERGYTTLLLHITGGAAAMQAARARLAVAVPEARWQPVRQIASGEERILLSTRAMLGATSALILLAVLLAVGAALTTLAIERRRDFGLMRALGSGAATVAGLWAGEAALLGLAAGLPGMLLGGLTAGVLSEALFGLWLWPPAGALAAALGLTLAVALAAALLPWPILHAATPAAALRGE